jgi:hypothetical protein
MKQKLVILIMGLFPFFGCVQKSNLVKTESDLLTEINFESALMAEVKKATGNELKQLPGIDQETGDVFNDKYYDGIYSETTENKAVECVKRLKSKFREKGYLIFLFEGEDDKKHVAVIKGNDDLDILRYRRTDGINYGLENDDIVQKISEWKSKYGLIVIGCDRDWLHVEFDNMPANLDEFADEVYKFCPDSVDQGVGTIDKLKQAIMEMKGVWLWWD